MNSLSIESFLAGVGALINSTITWLGQFWSFICGEPVLIILICGLPLVGLAIGILGRLFRA